MEIIFCLSTHQINYDVKSDQLKLCFALNMRVVDQCVLTRLYSL